MNLEKVRKIDKFAIIFLAKVYADTESFTDTMEYIKKIFDEPHKSWLMSKLHGFSNAVEELSRKYKRKELNKALREWRIQKDFHADIEKSAVELLQIKSSDTVLSINASDYGFVANIENKNVQIYRVGDSENLGLIGKMRAAVIDNLQVNRADLLNEDIALQADKVFCGFKGDICKNFTNKKLQKFFEDIRSRACAEWLYPIFAIHCQKSGGRTVAVMPENVLTNNADKEIRKKLVEMGKVEEVVSLEKFSLVVFSDNNKSVKMTDADKSVDVSSTEIAEKNYSLYPTRYLAEKQIRIKNAKLLLECVEIKRGVLHIRPSELEVMKSNTPTEYQYLNIQDIGEHGINENLQYLKPEFAKQYAERFFATSGDIVISKLSPFKIAVVPETDKKILLSGNLYAMQLQAKINPYYIMLFLKSEEGALQLNAMSSGGSARMITPNNLAEVKIPMIPIEEQNKIAENYLAIVKELEKVQQKLSALLKNFIH